MFFNQSNWFSICSLGLPGEQQNMISLCCLLPSRDRKSQRRGGGEDRRETSVEEDERQHPKCHQACVKRERMTSLGFSYGSEGKV